MNFSEWGLQWQARMDALVISVISFGLIFVAALSGIFLQRFLPEHHLESWESRDAVKLGVGLIATMSALVLGLLVGTAKTSFDVVNGKIIDSSAKIVVLDRLLSRYGPETELAREQLRYAVERRVSLIWPEEGLITRKGVETIEQSKTFERLDEEIHELEPKTDMARRLKDQALRVNFELMESHWLVIEQQRGSLPKVLIVVLVFWLATLNVTYGLLAHPNLTVIAVLLFCALSVSASIFLILELGHPLDGIIRVSSKPMRNALEHLGR
ncbi:MAG TPA: hypothetical protein VIT23_06340 [Terrimicrobiaceae bacterium]